MNPWEAVAQRDELLEALQRLAAELGVGTDGPAEIVGEVIDRVWALERRVFVPGLWWCVGCDFTLVESTLNARDGTVTPRDGDGGACPNCETPLARVSYQEHARTLGDRLAGVLASKPSRPVRLPRLRRVVVESPFAATTAEKRDQNIRYAQRALLDSLKRGEAPIASHLLHTQVLDDEQPADRDLGIAAGLAWTPVADVAAFYCDLGMSTGMRDGERAAREAGVEVEYRSIAGCFL